MLMHSLYKENKQTLIVLSTYIKILETKRPLAAKVLPDFKVHYSNLLKNIEAHFVKKADELLRCLPGADGSSSDGQGNH